jgi:hypothetical protein
VEQAENAVSGAEDRVKELRPNSKRSRKNSEKI